MQLVFHIGSSKTATTSIQSVLTNFKFPSVIYLGKLKSEANGKFCGLLDQIHYDLFRPYRYEIRFGHGHPSRGHHELIDSYPQSIVDQILQGSYGSASKIKTIIISDECIGRYFNFNAEMNYFLIGIIGTRVEQKLNDIGFIKHDEKSEKVISVGIREQADWITSIYSFIPTMVSFDAFFSRQMTSADPLFFNALKYHDQFTMLRDATDETWRINFVPYEISKVMGFDVYFSHITTIPEGMVTTTLENKVTKLNSNSFGTLHYNRRDSLIVRIAKQFLFKSDISFRDLPAKKWNRWQRQLVEGIRVLVAQTKPSESECFSMSQDIRQNIRLLFADQNLLLQQHTPQFDLQSLGYCVSGDKSENTEQRPLNSPF
ncbi:MAG: hypothetical protein ACON31_03630 [Candidatus Puniceispirillaceae bacterium]